MTLTKIIDTAEAIYSGLFLLIGVLLAAMVTSSYLLTLGVIVGAPLALTGSQYWIQVWLGFDRLWNAILGGDSLETVSSRLGKSVVFGYPSVFYYRSIDRTIKWWLNQIDHNHCEKSIDWHVGKGRH